MTFVGGKRKILLEKCLCLILMMQTLHTSFCLVSYMMSPNPLVGKDGILRLLFS